MNFQESDARTSIKLVRIVLPLAAILILAIALFALNAKSEYDHRVSLNNSEDYVLDFSSLFGSDWKATEIIKDDEDILGWDATIAGRSQLWTYNVVDPLVSVKHHVIAYISGGDAASRYTLQKASLISFFSKAPSSKDYYQELSLPNSVTSGIDQYYAVCQEDTVTETTCVGLFLYNRYIIFIQAVIVKNGVTYLSVKDLENVFSLVTNKISTS